MAQDTERRETWTRPVAWDAVDVIKRRVGSGAGVPETIRAVLESDDPSVHAAMAEALSRHGFTVTDDAGVSR